MRHPDLLEQIAQQERMVEKMRREFDVWRIKTRPSANDEALAMRRLMCSEATLELLHGLRCNLGITE